MSIMAGLVWVRSSSRLHSLSMSYRYRSSKPLNKAQLIEIEIDSSSSSSSSSPVRKLEDVIYSIIVRRSAPDWLPFMPGSSYWVPPRKQKGHAGLLDVITTFNNKSNNNDDDEMFPINHLNKGCWPSSSFFLQGTSPARPLPMDIQVVEVKFQEDSDSESRSEDEEN